MLLNSWGVTIILQELGYREEALKIHDALNSPRHGESGGNGEHRHA